MMTIEESIRQTIAQHLNSNDIQASVYNDVVEFKCTDRYMGLIVVLKGKNHVSISPDGRLVTHYIMMYEPNFLELVLEKVQLVKSGDWFYDMFI